MGIGEDIRDVYIEVGNRILVTSQIQGSTVPTEYIMVKTNTQATKPFIREFFLEAEFPYDTVAVEGDIIQMTDVGGTFHQVMNLTPEALENETFRKNAVLYKCNVTNGVLMRSSGEAWDEKTYQKTLQFRNIQVPCYALLSEPAFYGEVDNKTEIGLMSQTTHELYIPKSYGIEIQDRFQPVSGEDLFYRVENVLPNRYAGSDVAILVKDTR